VRSALERVADLVRRVLDLLARVLDVGLGLLPAALVAQLLVVGRRADRLLAAPSNPVSSG